ncbi:carboxymethylenebutenolidase [Paraburkholderia sp. GV068]|uniref:dienelactone hydrolase family protein n=1 Tax=Paraburkholderia TaxID=1822464 RepID=UPI000D4C80A2|nr:MULTISPECIES: dienelactone hydrolase family protein [unclassified Paraburkholderia]PTQ92996.1 carboxymethylenebutenolidase [Paraburkholderia sp. GV072]PUA99727.1 carboxymethylenebutenolidase [Paraburkholderia sp. GV068]
MGFNEVVKLSDGEMKCYASGSQDESTPAVIVIQEIFGVNANIRATTDRLAAAGFRAVAPDLFWRLRPGVALDPEQPDARAEAMQLAQRYGDNIDQGIADLAVLVAALRERHSKVGMVGYCLGGRVAFLGWLRLDVDAAVSYYGVGIAPLLEDMDAPEKPLLMHLGADDPLNPPQVQGAIAERLAREAQADVRVYEGAGHAFARLAASTYVESAAKPADEATYQFLQTHLG